MSRQIDVKALVSHIVRGDGADKCRICMGDTSGGHVYLTDTVMLDGDRPVTLLELLETLTGVEITEDAAYPLGVCVNCVSNAITANEFRNNVKYSQQIWTKTIASFLGLTLSNYQIPRTLGLLFRKDNLTMTPIIDCIGNNPESLAKSLNSKGSRKKSGTERKTRLAKNGPSCTCVDCGKFFMSPSCLAQHLKCSGTKDACLICGVVLLRGKEMAEHLQNIHKEVVYQCKECTNIFKNSLDLETHERNAHNPNSMTCGDCGRTFTRIGSFEAHSQMHAIRTCRHCGKQFTNRGCYRVHRAMCEPDAKPNLKELPRSRRCNVRDLATFTCAYCDKSYNSRPQLKNHIIWIHMNIRPYQCQWCGKRFYTPGRLTEHSVVHTRVRNFECDICGMKLVSKMAAVYHRRRHTGEKPYNCPDCGECFISASRRSEHAKRKHKKGAMLQCIHCSNSFVRGHELRKHMAKAHSQVAMAQVKTIT